MSRIWVRLWLGIVAAGVGLIIFTVLSLIVVDRVFRRTAQSESSLGSVIVLVGMACGALFTVGVALWLAWHLMRPIVAISEAARLITRGDLSVRATTQTRGKNEITQLLQDFNVMAESLEKLETERKSTTATIAHELRTPITVLRGRLAALRDGVFEFSKAELDILLQQTELLARLVEDLRILSLAEVGKLSLELAEIEFAALVRTTVSSFETQAAAKQVRLELCVPEHVTVYGDEVRLRQVIANLLANAIHFTPEGGRVGVRLEARENKMSLEIRDSGEGVPKENLPHLFNRFYKSDDAKSGSGLGLAIVKSFVELHGGQVSAANHLEGGAVFRVTLPARAINT
jgi:two-component system, OmpR family, sensor histidine kinase BaeS